MRNRCGSRKAWAFVTVAGQSYVVGHGTAQESAASVWTRSLNSGQSTLPSIARRLECVAVSPFDPEFCRSDLAVPALTGPNRQHFNDLRLETLGRQSAM